MTLNSQRRLGLILGLALGLGFAVTSNFVNQWVMPEIPLRVPEPGLFAIILLTAAAFGFLGLLAAWTEESVPGILLCGVAGSLISSIWMLVSGSSNLSGTFALLLLVFLPRIFFYLPLGWLVRWLLNKLIQRPYANVPPARKWISVVASFIVVALLGLFSLHPAETRTSLARMEIILRDGSQATTLEELPRSLQNVNGFLVNAQGSYTYEIGSNPDVLPVQRPIVEYGEVEPFIIVKFENGFRFGCVFSPPYIVPACIDF